MSRIFYRSSGRSLPFGRSATYTLYREDQAIPKGLSSGVGSSTFLRAWARCVQRAIEAPLPRVARCRWARSFGDRARSRCVSRIRKV
jgi:hypothetical protein